MTAVVSVRHLTKRFGAVTAVDDIGFDIAEREFFSLLGPSGCGKTTTLRCVAGLESADAGQIRIGDGAVFDAGRGLDLPPNRRAIGMVFQSYAVWPHMTVFDNIAYPLKIRGLARAEIAARVAQVLGILGMEALGRRMPSQLSGGQQQRVALGRALAVEPTVLLLDEPLSNLDAKLRESMRAELKQIQKETGIPILYVTHDQVEAMAMSDRIAVMSEGRIHQLAAPDEVYRRPATRFVLDFIGTVNYLPCRLLDADEDGVMLRWDGNRTLRLPRPPRLPRNEAVLLAVRPEDLAFAGDGAGEGAGALEGRVTLRSFLGNICEYRVRVADTEIRVQTDKTVEVAEGDTVGLRIKEALLLDHADAADPAEPVI